MKFASELSSPIGKVVLFDDPAEDHFPGVDTGAAGVKAKGLMTGIEERELKKEFEQTADVYEAPVLRVHGTLEEMTHGGGGHRGGHRPHRPHDPCDYTFS